MSESVYSDKHAASASVFKALHEGPGLFVIPNPWDAGSAVLLARQGFKALATTSAGLAFSLGKADGNGTVSKAEALENVRSIVAATDLPVAADLENGYGDAPDICAATILEAAACGLAGGSIEDATGRPGDPIYSFDHAVRRVEAAVQAVRSLSVPFMLTARAENLIHGRSDLADTIRRLVAYAEAGADVLYAPGLQSEAEIQAVVRAVAPKPVNVLMGMGSPFTLRELEDLGVRRVSLGSSLARVAYSAFIQAAKTIHTEGHFSFSGNLLSYDELNAVFG